MRYTPAPGPLEPEEDNFVSLRFLARFCTSAAAATFAVSLTGTAGWTAVGDTLAACATGFATRG